MKYVDEWRDGCMDVCFYVWMDACTCMDGWIDGGMDAWICAFMDGWMDGSRDGEMDGCSVGTWSMSYARSKSIKTANTFSLFFNFFKILSCSLRI